MIPRVILIAIDVSGNCETCIHTLYCEQVGILFVPDHCLPSYQNVNIEAGVVLVAMTMGEYPIFVFTHLAFLYDPRYPKFRNFVHFVT